MVPTAQGRVKLQRSRRIRRGNRLGRWRSAADSNPTGVSLLIKRFSVSLDPLLAGLLLAGLIGLCAGLLGAVRRSPALMVVAGFLVLGATSFAVTALALA